MTDLSTSDLADLRASLRMVLDRKSSEEAVRAVMAGETGVNCDLWRSLTSDFELASLAVPESCGGAGVGWAVSRVLLEDLGGSLACVPALSVIGLALPALEASGDMSAVKDLMPGILAGTTIATAALLGTDPVSACRVRAIPTGDSWELTGEVPYVLDGQVVDLVLLLARHDAGLALFAVDRRSSGATLAPRPTSDLTRRAASLSLTGTTARLVGGPDSGADIVAAARPAALLALGCEQTGGAAAALADAVAYAGQRVQFGRAIGSFQAVKHRLADVLVAVEECRSATWATAAALDSGAPDAELMSYAAAAVCGAAYVKAASDNVQVHAGIGYTWEHSAHLHVKRSRGSAALLGTPAEHRRKIAGLLPHLTDDHTPLSDGPTSRSTQGAHR